MKLYSIRNWDNFETCETRKLEYLKWVPTPNKHDGLGFRRMAAQRNRCELFAGWNLIFQVASKGRKGSERGRLIRDGVPLSAEDLAIMTGFPASVFQTALDFFSSPQIGWLLIDNKEDAEPPVLSGDSPGSTGINPAEGKEGREGKKEGLGLVFPQHLRTEGFQRTWDKWEAFRRTKGSVKDWVSFFQDQLNWLSEFPEPTAASILETSLLNGWQGIFKPKGQISPSPKQNRHAIPNI